MEEIKGVLTDIVFHNEENGYTVAEVETEDELITAVGSLPSVRAGQTYVLRGDWKKHPVYGEQFAFSAFEQVRPETEDGIREFLASGVIRGIGPKTAHAIVQKFGAATLDVLDHDPDRLLQVPGIGPKSLEKIILSYEEQRVFTDVSLFFSRYGIPVSQAVRMYKAYGAETIPRIQEDPYCLIEDVRGIGFRKADEIAGKLGIGQDSAFRIRACIRYLLLRRAGDGDTCAPLADFREETAELLGLTREQIQEVIVRMAFEGEVKLEMVHGQDMIYLYSYYDAETRTARQMAVLAAAKVKALTADVTRCIQISETETGRTLSEEQKNAVRGSLESGISVITGGPGTGKTTVLSALLAIFSYSGLSVQLAAPTGRAAKRITETTGRPAFTIHRLLEYFHDDAADMMRFGKTAEDPLETDVVIVDEASMIDLLLMRGLTEALQPGTRLILVGDADQLPSVGAGNVLHDVMESGLAAVSRLTEIFRQAGESKIIVNAHRINHGERLEVNGRDSDFFFLEESNERRLQDLLADLVMRRLPAHYRNLDPVRDIQIITPIHRGNIGTEVLNNLLQDVFNPPAPGKNERKHGGQIFRVGDKVMQTRNNYQLTWSRPGEDTQAGVFNGDVGFIHAIDLENGTTTVVYDGDRYVEYDNQMLDDLLLAYAITVHKSQGSEFPAVVMPIGNFPPMIASRNLLYTAVTRGRELVVLAGSWRMLNAMIANDRIRQRYSGLEQRLSDLVPFVK